MANPPAFIQEAETAFNSTTSPKTTGSFNVQANDILVAFSMAQDYGNNISVSGGSLTWTNRQTIRIAGYCQMLIATALVDVDKSMTVSFTKNASDTYWFGGNCLTFRGSGGYDTSSKTNVASGAPTLNITTGAANCVIVVANADWNAVDGASRVWRTNAGAFTEQTYDFQVGTYTSYGGFHANAGAAGTYAVGLSAPGGQHYAIVALSLLSRPAAKAISALGVGG
jgi:hypothetical protein